MDILTKSTEKGRANICLGYMCEEKINREQIVFIFYANMQKFQCKGKKLIESLTILPLSY